MTPTELVEAAIERIEALNPTLNAVVTTAFDEAIDAARALPRGPALPFAGVPLLLKDLITECVGMRFTEGSFFLRDNVSTHDQELVVRLRRAGFVILGKTNTPEFGMAPHCEPRLFGATRNPWNVELSTAGSSGGSAAAVASGHGPGRARQRPRWIDPLPGVVLRALRPEADASPCAARTRVRGPVRGDGRRARADPDRP